MAEGLCVGATAGQFYSDTNLPSSQKYPNRHPPKHRGSDLEVFSPVIDPVSIRIYIVLVLDSTGFY